MINNIPVVKINDVAFSNPEQIFCLKDDVETEYPRTYIPKDLFQKRFHT